MSLRSLLQIVVGAAMLSFLTPVPAIAADFAYNPIEHSIQMVGVLKSGDYLTFKTLAENTNPKVLLMTSIGGAFGEAQRMGIYVQSHHMDTVAQSTCYSACAYIWLAGRAKMYDDTGYTYSRMQPDKRHYDTDIVIHNPHSGSLPVQIDVPIGISMEGWYFGQIGLSQQVALDVAFHNGQDVLELDDHTMDRWGLKSFKYSDYLKLDPSVRYEMLSPDSRTREQLVSD